jgi:hypothetical protein
VVARVHLVGASVYELLLPCDAGRPARGASAAVDVDRDDVPAGAETVAATRLILRSLPLDRRGFRSEVGEVGHRDVSDELRHVVERGQPVGVKALVGGEVWHLDSQ